MREMVREGEQKEPRTKVGKSKEKQKVDNP